MERKALLSMAFTMLLIGLIVSVGVDVYALQQPEIESVVLTLYHTSSPPEFSAAPTPSDEDPSYRLFRGGVKWASSALPISYHVNPTYSGVDDLGAVVTAVNASFATWDSEVTVSLYDHATHNDTAGPGRDDYNTVSWSPLEVGIVAQCTFWYWLHNKTLVEFDIVFSTDYLWGIDADGEGDADYLTGKFDIQNVGTHEAGHTLVLEDLYVWKHSELTMYGYTTEGETKKRSLGLGDRLGVQKLYGG
jgi:hypothetical protein